MRYIQRQNKDANKAMRYIERRNKDVNKANEIYTKAKQKCKQRQ